MRKCENIEAANAQRPGGLALGLAAAGLLLFPALAHSAVTDDYDLAELAPLDVYVANTNANAGSLYLSGGGVACAGMGEVRPSSGGADGAAFYLESATYGSLVSEVKPDFALGEWCTYFDLAEGQEIDWERTSSNLFASVAYAEGRVMYNKSATNDLSRVMFTRGGSVEVKWYVKGVDEPVSQVYNIAESSATRPYRIFWTENGFGGPTVLLKDTTGQSIRYVRLLGDPAIIGPEYSVTVMQHDPLVETTNIVKGVVVNEQVNAIQVYAKRGSDDVGDHDGPRGQFVLAYYDTGTKDNLIYTIVVEVDAPDVAVINANVGDEIKPTGEGYSIDHITANIYTGNLDDPGDPASPYLYKHQGQTDFSPKTGSVFAIAPTDASSQASALDSPHKADIWWESTDPMGTEWPFEHDQYLIKWPKDSPVVVTGGSATPGCGVLVPEKYHVETGHYSDPANIAKVTSNAVSVAKSGNFLLKFTADDNIWFAAMRSVLDTDTNVFDSAVADVPVGTEIKPRTDAMAGISADIARLVDASLPGYIHEAGSPGRNWNPHIYHAPRVKTASDGAIVNDADPYANLTSAVYAVSASENQIEVWWFRTYAQDGMTESVLLPTLAQFYHAVWPQPQDVHSIVLASQKGSAGESVAATSKALYLGLRESCAITAVDALGTADAGATIGFWLNPSPAVAGYPLVEHGRLFTVALTNDAEIAVEALGPTRLAVAGQEVDVPSNSWSHIALAFETNGLVSVYRDGAKVAQFASPDSAFASLEAVVVVGGSYDYEEPDSFYSATGIAVDQLTVWPFALDPEGVASYVVGGTSDSIARKRYEWTFDGVEDLAPVSGLDGLFFAEDSASGEFMIAFDSSAQQPGGPARSNGLVASYGGVAPRIYYENDGTAVGYNPNEEHAFLREGADGYTVWALRCDLNRANSSEPFVLVEYNDGGKCAMRAYGVSLRNHLYSSLSSEATAGNLLSGPHPLDLMDGYYNTKNYCLDVLDPENANDGFVIYRDRKNRMWARRDGLTMQFNYYPVQEGFWFPSLVQEPQPAVGTLVGWMSLDAIESPTLEQIMNAPPEPWLWDVEWPADDKLPTMRVGQTLTKADAGLPEVWNALSMAVVYPVPYEADTNRAGTVVTLIDPTVAQTAPLEIESNFPSEYGFTVGPSGTCQLKSGKYYFTGLPPNISDRFYIDTNAGAEKRMVLVGKMVEKNAGKSYLQVNMLSAAERQALKDICKTDGEKKTAWDDGVDQLATSEVQPSTRRIENVTFEVDVTDGGVSNAVTGRVAVDYAPKDHYALVANGCGSGYVTLIENDSPDEAAVPSGSTISMHVLKVVPEYYAGDLVVLQDPNNKLSEQLNVLYTAPFGQSADNFTFEWRKRYPSANGVVPPAGDGAEWLLKTNGVGATSILLGGSGANLTELVNTYYEMRYKALEGTEAYALMGDAWSGWCGPTLAEGWVQRVLNNITPFAQRMSNFYDNAAELKYAMPEQIGGPYNGDVALNDANLENIGLVQLYQTVLNKAESLSLSLGIEDMNANKQLLMAASRLADLYALLGDEAYSDAVNPTIQTSSLEGHVVDYETFPASTYCFANQMPSLLDEELALLRGRTKAVAPNTTTYPYYNRLMWNFTKGITQGEMAYVQNYGIRGSNGEITAEQAAAQYPMGHGDAYGHYLSSVWGYYRLLRNPYFDWGNPGMMEMLVADSIVNMDYEDEQKFALFAAKMAQAGADVVDLTARKTWRDQNGDTFAGYFDANSEQGFGYGEWAVRTGLGALYNWATANSLLPTNATASLFADKSISDVTRQTVPALDLLAEKFAAVDRKLNLVDSGLNPLGLSDNSIPFDIDPRRLEAGESHFEQILERAERALDNAQAVLDYADKFGARLSQIAQAEADASSEAESFEAACNKELIAIYGTPYPDDIGPSGTYVQGYDGPDLYHYNYMDLGPYGLSELETKHTSTITIYAEASNEVNKPLDYVEDKDANIPIVYNVSSGGLLVKPSTWTGVRRTEGTIQSAYRDFLAAYINVQHMQTQYDDAVGDLKRFLGEMQTQWDNADARLSTQNLLTTLKAASLVAKTITDPMIAVAETADAVSEIVYENVVNGAPDWVVGGLAIGSDAIKAAANIPAGAVKLGIKTAGDATVRACRIIQETAANVVDNVENMVDGWSASVDLYDTRADLHAQLTDRVGSVKGAAFALHDAIGDLSAAEAAYRAEVAKGDALLAEREMLRKQQANEATAMRYRDMYCRVQKNSALSKFNIAFDIAQRYVWHLAKVYDYETGLLSGDKPAGDAFLRETVATRALGRKGVSIVADGTDGGLWDIVTRMKGNWDVVKGRLGVNNPETATKWFSLRYSLFRIKSGEEGDEAWRRELAKYVVDDIFADREVGRYCQPPQGGDGAARLAEPGFVIPFSSTVNLAENFFGKPLLGGETTFSSSDYAVKIGAVGVDFSGYGDLAVATAQGLAADPNIYLVPVGHDYMRTPAGTNRRTLMFTVVDQVLPLPYTVGSTELNDEDWFATFSGLDGTVDSAATIRRHSTMGVGGETTSSRLVGRSVWNDRWLLVIPASSLSSDRVNAIKTFVNGLDTDSDGQIDIPGVSDIRIGIRASSRSGN